MESTQVATATSPASEHPRGSSADPGTIGRFAVLRRLGEGGMGVVYSAFDEQLGRRVAIKVLHHADDSDLARARVYHEAQALARLSHPNVVQVYEVGEHDDALYVAMEFVTGETLRAWMNHGGHDWRATVEVFVQTGQGLAAAHLAGLVHRDFKPENTVIGEDGRPRVLDFGLALHAQHALPEPSSGPVVETADTHAVGPVVGTPRYMSPEQHEGRLLDARSDQFSFCVALWEALHGEPPHAGDTLLELVHNTINGTLRPPPARAAAPEWLRGVLIRGLAVRPQDRWPDMPTLLTALRSDPRVRRRRFAAVALAVSVAAGLLALALRRDDPCAAVTDAAREAWSPATRQAIETAFQASGAPFAASSWTMLAGQVDAYVGEWVSAREALCVDHHAARQSDELHDLGVECLDDRLSQLRAQLDALTGADALAVEKASGVRSRLRPISGCTDSRALRARPRPPEALARRTAADAVRSRIDALAARRELGQFEDAIPRAQALVAEATPIEDGPLLAEALYELGRCEEALGKYEAAERSLRSAFFTAGRVYHDRVAATAAWRLCILSSQIRADVESARLWSQHMEVATSRLGDPGELLAELYNARGNTHYREGRLKEALAQIERGRALLAEVAPDDEMSRARFTFNIGVMHKALGDFAAAQSAYDDALAVGLRQVGPQHPFVAMLTQNVGSLLLTQGRFVEADAVLRRAFALLEHSHATDLAGIALISHNLGEVGRGSGHLEDAEVWLRRAVDGRSRVLGKAHRDTAISRAVLGSVLHRRGRDDEARAALMQAEADLRDSNGAGDVLGRVLAFHGELLLDRGELVQARLRLEQALVAHATTELGASRALVEARIPLAQLDLLEGRLDEARVHAEIAHTTAKDGIDWPHMRATADFTLARVYKATGAPREQVAALAREADERYEAAGPHTAADRARVAAFLADLDAAPGAAEQIKDTRRRPGTPPRR